MSESACWYALADAQKAFALWTWRTFRVWEALIAQATAGPRGTGSPREEKTMVAYPYKDQVVAVLKTTYPVLEAAYSGRSIQLMHLHRLPDAQRARLVHTLQRAGFAFLLLPDGCTVYEAHLIEDGDLSETRCATLTAQLTHESAKA